MMNSGIKAASMILLAASFAMPALAQTSGEAVYKAKCALCHGADGLANTPAAKSMKMLSFKDPSMLKASDARFALTTRNGEGKMPAYNGKLTDAQIKDVIAYIRTLQK
ncbi:MAG: cytochrome c [Terracidiphilus sp.]|jgi:mono/diheme cytochrome c family protein